MQRWSLEEVEEQGGQTVQLRLGNEVAQAHTGAVNGVVLVQVTAAAFLLTLIPEFCAFRTGGFTHCVGPALGVDTGRECRRIPPACTEQWPRKLGRGPSAVRW
eukprot:248337-Rhodomonas_salina.1